MKCDRIKEMMIDYLYGELSQDQAEAFQAHLEECPACAEEVEQLGLYRKLASESPDPEPSALAIQRLVTTAREEADNRKPLWSFGWFKALATLCVMVIVGGVVLYQVKNSLVKPTTVSQAPVKKAPAEPPATEMIATGPKTAAPAKPEKTPVPEPTSVLNGSTDVEEHVAAAPETKSGGRTASRESEVDEKLYVIDRRSGEPIPVETEVPKPRTKSSAGTFLAGSTGETRTEPSAAAKSAMDRAEGDRGTAYADQHLTEAQTALDSGQYDRAVHILNDLVNALPAGHPDRPRALILLAEAYEKQGMKGQAAAVWGELAGVSPDHAEMARQRIEALSKP